MANVLKSLKDIPEIQEPEFDDSIYKNKSLKELDDLGFEGWHNVIINKLRNSAYDTPDAAIQAAEKRTDWTPKQKAYVRAYANQIFGVTPEQDRQVENQLNDDDYKTAQKYELDLNQVQELKNKFTGDDYKTALDRLAHGEAFGDVLSGVIKYEGK